MNGKGRKPKKGARAAKKKGGGLLARLFKGDAKAERGKKVEAKAKAKAGPPKARPLTPLERSIQEIKHMATVGKSDPERLAMLLSRLLSQERDKQRLAREQFDRMVWDIVNREEKSAAEEGDG